MNHSPANTNSLCVKKSALYMLTLLLLSGNPLVAVTLGWEAAIVGISLYFSFEIKNKGMPLLERNGVVVFGLLTGILLLQSVSFGLTPLITDIGFLLRVYIAYCSVRLIDDFLGWYLFIFYWLAIVGVTIWLVSKTGILSPIVTSFPPWKANIWIDLKAYAFGIHTFYIGEGFKVLRNAGMFWEPGAFAGYLNLAIAFLGMSRERFTKKEFQGYMLVFIVALLTTMSTAGYLLAPIALLFSMRLGESEFQIRRFFSNLFIGGALALAFLILVFTNVEFLAKKVEHQLTEAMNLEVEELGLNNSRFSTMLFDWLYIKRSPFWGNGLHESTRYRFHDETTRIQGQGNGLTDFTAKFGFAGLLIFMFYTFRFFYFSSSSSSKLMASTGVLFILLSLWSETFLNYPLYLCLLFLWFNRGKQLDGALS